MVSLRNKKSNGELVYESDLYGFDLPVREVMGDPHIKPKNSVVGVYRAVTYKGVVIHEYIQSLGDKDVQAL